MYKYFLSILIIILTTITGYTQPTSADEVVHKVEGRGFIKNWLITGTFPSPEVNAKLPDGSGHPDKAQEAIRILRSLGLGQGHSTLQWSNSFEAWLKDIDMIQ